MAVDGSTHIGGHIVAVGQLQLGEGAREQRKLSARASKSVESDDDLQYDHARPRQAQEHHYRFTPSHCPRVHAPAPTQSLTILPN